MFTGFVGNKTIAKHYETKAEKFITKKVYHEESLQRRKFTTKKVYHKESLRLQMITSIQKEIP